MSTESSSSPTTVLRPLHEACLVDDLDKAVAFYTNVLGFEKMHRPDEYPGRGAWLRLPEGMELHLFEDDGNISERAQRLGRHTAWQIGGDMASFREHLVNHGIDVEELTRQGSPNLFISDPAGNVWEFQDVDGER